MQIGAEFRLIALLRLTDPYTLPAGMTAALRQYFRMHSGLSSIQSDLSPDAPGFRLTGSAQTEADDGENPIYLNISDLMTGLIEDIGKLDRHNQATAVGLPREIPAPILLRCLRQVQTHWHNHPTRRTSREDTPARIDMVAGLDAAYCMVNKGRPFDPRLFLAPGHENVIDLGDHPAAASDTAGIVPDTFDCSVLNRSNGGLAIRYHGAQQPHPRVGQLVALRRSGGNCSDGWVIAAVRWLLQSESGSGFDLGLQYLARDPKPVVIRAMDKSGLGGDYQPAITADQKRREQRVHTLMIRGGETLTDSALTLYEPGGQVCVRCVELLESSSGFDRLIYEPMETADCGD